MVLFVGSFYPWHDVATLLAAFAQVLTTYPDVRLVFGGRGGAATEHAAAAAGIRD